MIKILFVCHGMLDNQCSRKNNYVSKTQHLHTNIKRNVYLLSDYFQYIQHFRTMVDTEAQAIVIGDGTTSDLYNNI